MRAAVSIVIFALLASPAMAKPRQVSDYEWQGVERIVAIGDIHGDYDNYMATLKAAGLVDRKGRWAGGETHLVQRPTSCNWAIYRTAGRIPCASSSTSTSWRARQSAKAAGCTA